MNLPIFPGNPKKGVVRCESVETLEWVQKAEGDYAVAQQVQQAQNPVHDAICFHAQQCIEKYLKAWLQEANIPFPRTHDLKELLGLIVPTLPTWHAWQADFSVLSEHAVDSRYPGKFATTEDTVQAMHICNEVRQASSRAVETMVDFRITDIP